MNSQPRTMEIGGRKIGRGRPVLLIAELSANHNNDFDEAVRLVHAAKEAGADAVKLQTYTPDTLTIECDSEHFRVGKGTLWENRTLYDLYEEAFMPWDWQPRLKSLADELGMLLFSTPFDNSSVEFLETMDMPAYKIASFENVDIPLIRRVGATGKPVILSTGMANEEEIDEAVTTLREAGCREIALLKCTSAYPAPADEMNLATIEDLARRFDVVSGLSDHTMGHTVAVTSVALGASLIEKHFTLSRDVPGPDSAFSMEPREFREMVDAVRLVEEAVGNVNYATTPTEEPSRVFRRSLFVVEDIQAGMPFTEKNLRAIRPGYGMHTRHIDELIGKSAACDIKKGTPMSWDLVVEAPAAEPSDES